MPVFHVLFDLDGTLTDPKPGITRCIAYALERLGLPAIDPETLTWCIGPPLRGSLGQLIGTDDHATVATALAYYRERFGDIGLFENSVYEGIPAVLAALKEQGARLHVATSKPQTYTDRILEEFGLAGFFDRVVGSELDGTREKKSEIISHVLALESFPADLGVMVGDRMQDVEGAREVGMRCIGALYGYGLEGELEAAGAWPLVEAPAELQFAVALCRRGGG